MDLPGASNNNSTAIAGRHGFAERLRSEALPWDQWQGSRLAEVLEPDLGTEIPELRTLAREPNAEMFFHQLFHWAGQLEARGKEQAAGILLTWIQANSPFAESRNLAAERLELWQGRGKSGALFEMALTRGSKELLQPSVLLGFGLGGLASRVTRLSVLSRFFAGESPLFLTRGLTSRLAWEALGILVEAPVFTLSQAALGRTQGALPEQLAANFLSLGAMRLMGGAFSHFNLYSTSNLSREVLTEAANFTGLLAGRALEQATGLREPTSRSLWLMETIFGYVQIQTAQHLTGGLLGRDFRAFEQAVEQRWASPRPPSNPEGFSVGIRPWNLASVGVPGTGPFSPMGAARWEPETSVFSLKIEELPSSKVKAARLWESAPDHAEGLRQLIAGKNPNILPAAGLNGPLADYIRYNAAFRSELQARALQDDNGLLIRLDPGEGRVRQIFFFSPQGQPERVFFEHSVLRYDENLDPVLYELNFSDHPSNGKSGPELTAKIYLPRYQDSPDGSSLNPPAKATPTVHAQNKLGYEFFAKSSYHIQVFRQGGVWQVQGEWGYPLFEIKP